MQEHRNIALWLAAATFAVVGLMMFTRPSALSLVLLGGLILGQLALLVAMIRQHHAEHAQMHDRLHQHVERIAEEHGVGRSENV